jgi:hypothetical protein
MGVEQQGWSFRSLFTFLNELFDDWGRIRNRVLGSQHLKVYSADKDGKGDRRVTVKVDEEWNLSMQISRPDVVVWDKWKKITRQEDTSHGTRSRENKEARMRSITYWIMLVANMRGGNSWINHAAFAVVDAHEFHPIILTLSRKLIDSRLLRRPPTFFVFALHASFATDKRHQHVLTEAAFLAAIPGYLHLDIGV